MTLTIKQLYSVLNFIFIPFFLSEICLKWFRKKDEIGVTIGVRVSDWGCIKACIRIYRLTLTRPIELNGSNPFILTC